MNQAVIAPSARAKETFERWCKRCYMTAGIIAAAAGFFVVFVMFNRGLAIQYGGPGSVTILNAKTGSPDLSAGDDALICFKDAKWLRLCPSTLVQVIKIDGRQFDLVSHRIEPPQHTGPLPPKCRPVKMPLFGDGVTGRASFTGFARSKCWPTDEIWPIETPLPEANFTIKGTEKSAAAIR